MEKTFSYESILFWDFADFDSGNEVDNSNIGDKTTNIYEQNLILTGLCENSDLEAMLKSGYYESTFGPKNVDWYVNEVTKLEKEKAFFFENTKKDIIMTNKDEEDYRNNNICRFCEKKVCLIKFVIIVT